MKNLLTLFAVLLVVVPAFAANYNSAYLGTEIDAGIGLANTALQPGDVDDTPVNGATTVPPSSNWAYDHENATTSVHGIVNSATLLVDGDIGVTVQAYNAGVLESSDIGVTVQPYNAATLIGTVTAGDVDSEASTDGHVLTSDGLGGAAWEAVAGGGGGAFSADAQTQITPTTPIVLDEATGNETALSLDYTVNKATSGNDTGFKLNMTDTASPGTSLLIDAQVGGTSMFSVGSDGFLTIAGDTGSGFDIRSNAIRVFSNGNPVAGFRDLAGRNFNLVSTATLGWVNSTDTTVNADLTLARDAADTLALRNSTNAQEVRVYGTYTSTSSYHRFSIKTAKTTLSAVSGASVTASSLIPDGAFLIGVTSRINTNLGTSNGTTGYTVGDGVDADLWGALVATTAGSSTGSADFTAASASGLYTAANDVVVTATGGNFDGTGAIELVIHYLTTESD